MGAELDRSAAISMKVIYVVGDVNMLPAVIASATLSSSTITALNIARPLASLSKDALKKFLGREAVILLRDLFNKGIISAGLSRATLEAYRELAIRIIAASLRLRCQRKECRRYRGTNA